jgi:hypothetical protein
MLTKSQLAVVTVLSLGASLLNGSALAGSSRGGSIAAGIIGAAIGSAIIMQGQRAGAAYRQPRHKSRPNSPEAQATNSKDPFAGASAPADYARPVSTNASAAH